MSKKEHLTDWTLPTIEFTEPPVWEETVIDWEVPENLAELFDIPESIIKNWNL